MTQKMTFNGRLLDQSIETIKHRGHARHVWTETLVHTGDQYVPRRYRR